MRRWTGVVALGGLALLATASPARAEDRTATGYFNDGLRLMAQGPAKYPEACTSFEHALAQGSGAGTKFNLADCYDKTRRPAQALALFRDVEDITRQAGQKERSDAARERAAEVQSRVPRVLVHAPDLASNPDAMVLVDGKLVMKDSLAKPLPLDFGKHEIVVRLAGRETTASVDLETDHQLETVTVHVPALPPPPPPVAVVVVAPPPPFVPANHTQRNLGWIVGGVGLAALVVGGVVAIDAKVRYSGGLADYGCNDGRCTDPAATGFVNGTRSEANAGGIVALVGLAAALAGGTLWATAPSDRAPLVSASF